MNVFLDIETIPGQSCFQSFLDQAKAEFRAPSSMTKGQAAEELGLTDEQEIKALSKDAMIAKWERHFAEVKAPQVAEQEWRKTSFSGATGELFSIAWAVEDDQVSALARSVKTINGTPIFSSEAELLQSFYDSLERRLAKRKPFFIGQFVAGFDLKFIFQRSVIHNIRPPFPMHFNGRHEHDYFDNQVAWIGTRDRASQDSICGALGIEGKPDDIDGSKVWDFVKSGNAARVVEYNCDDVCKSRQIYKRLTFAA